MKEIIVYVGGYASESDAGLNVYRLDPASGALEHRQAVVGIANPSLLDIGPDQRCLYTINEVTEFAGSQGGGVSAFAIDAHTGELQLLNQQSSVGSGPCYIDVEQTGRFALVANYGGGSVTLLPIAADGSLQEASDFVQHQGSGPDPQRQTGPHAHSINVDPTNTFAFAPDLGLDKVMCYRLDLEAGKLIAHEPPWIQMAPASGPRHMAFHPNGRFAYVITEMSNTVVVFAYDAPAGTLREVQTCSTLPPGFGDTSYCADIHLSADGRFLYGSNRGHDSLAIFAVDADSGRLELVATPASGGEFPRNFCLDPSGAFLLAANQNSDNLVVYHRDAASGQLSPTGQQITVSKPVCVRVLEI